MSFFVGYRTRNLLYSCIDTYYNFFLLYQVSHNDTYRLMYFFFTFSSCNKSNQSTYYRHTKQQWSWTEKTQEFNTYIRIRRLTSATVRSPPSLPGEFPLSYVMMGTSFWLQPAHFGKINVANNTTFVLLA